MCTFDVYKNESISLIFNDYEKYLCVWYVYGLT